MRAPVIGVQTAPAAQIVGGARGAVTGDGAPMAGRVLTSWRVLLLGVLFAAALGAVLHEAASGGRQSALPAALPAHTPGQMGLLGLPLAARAPVSAALGAAQPAYRVGACAGGLQASNPAQRLHATFGRAGILIRSGDTSVGLSLAGVGFTDSTRPLAPVSPTARANRVTYRRDGLSEWYENGPLGLEQGFTVAREAAGHGGGPLTLVLSVSGNAQARLERGGHGVSFSHAGGPSLRYAGLRASDADGRPLRSWLELRKGGMLLRVDVHGARFPLKIDPVIEQKMLSPNEETGDGEFGYSVALSLNGGIALVGVPQDNGGVGAAMIFLRTRTGVWFDSTKVLKGGSEEGGDGEFGYSVALSATGETALVGAPLDSLSGSAWVFTRGISGATLEWKQQGKKFKATNASSFGDSVALSPDGKTALIGDVGADDAWVFAPSGGEWKEAQKLVGGSEETSYAAFGQSVAMAGGGFGSTALIGGPDENSYKGAAWAFKRSGGGASFAQQGKKLTGGAEETSNGIFGWRVALSPNGETALIGAPGDNGSKGAAWIFTPSSAGEWEQRGKKLTGGSTENGQGAFGQSVALGEIEGSDHALIGAPNNNSEEGAVWEFTGSGTTWTFQQQLKGNGESLPSQFGESVALSTTGSPQLIGAPKNNGSKGGAWIYQEQHFFVICDTNIIGRGASLLGSPFMAWTPPFLSTCVDPEVTYLSTSSGAGLASWGVGGGSGSFGPTNAFIGTEEPPNPGEKAQIESHGAADSLETIPVLQEAIVPIVHLPAKCVANSTAAPGRLVLDNATLEGIFRGTIKSWSEITEDGDTVSGSGCVNTTPITKIVRRESAGTTHILKKYLGLVNAAPFEAEGATSKTWSEVSEGSANTQWPKAAAVDRPAESGDDAEIAAVAGTASSIGYAGLADARAVAAFGSEGGPGKATFWPEVQNDGTKSKGAKYADPSSDGESEAPAEANCAKTKYTTNGTAKLAPPSTTASWSEVTTATKEKNYPICGLAYVLALDKYSAYPETTAAEAETTKSLLQFLVAPGEGQEVIQGRDYEPLPKNLSKTAAAGAAAIAF